MPLIVKRGLAAPYTTTFPLTENPLSEGGRWINGGTTGLDWKDVRTTPGQSFGVGASPSPPYNDPTAILIGDWGLVQTVEARVIVPASSAQNQEVELRLLTTIIGHRILGYEVLFSVTGGSVAAPQAMVTGNRIKATITQLGVITAYIDYGTGRILGDPAGYQQVAQGTDMRYRAGAPGIGMFQHAGSDATMSDYGISAFLCWAA